MKLEIKTKVKYYPVLVEVEKNKFAITNQQTKFKTFEDALKTLNYKSFVKVIRLVTEIPELIEEREE